MNKQEILKKLNENGFRTIFSPEGVPTVLIEQGENIKTVAGRIKSLSADLGYNQSFSVRHIKKSDSEGVADELLDIAG